MVTLGEFNYKRYLNSKGIYGTITLKSFEVIQNDDNKSLIDRFKENISSTIDNVFSKQYAGLLKSMLYGDKFELDETIENNFKTLGISHITSVSGSNLAMFISVIGLIFQNSKKNKWIKFLIELLSVIFFNLICAGEYSILRASICFVLSNVFYIFKKKVHPIKTLILSLYILIILNPYSVFNLGLQLSYLATLGIVVFSKKLSYSMSKPFKKLEKKKRIYKLISVVIGCISLTLSAQVFVLPVQIVSFNTISPMLILSNILVYYITMPILSLGLFSIIVSFVPILPMLILKITFPFIWFLVNITELLAKITPSLSIPSFPLIIWIMYYGVVFGFLYIDKHIGEIIKIKERYIKKENILKVLLTVSFVILVTFSYVYIACFEEYLYFFNVGQGSTAFLRYNGVNIILDAGSLKQNLSFNTLDNFFKQKGIEEIDLVILSHFHTDHVNAISSLIQSYNVKEVVYSLPKEENALFESISTILEEKNIKMSVVDSGDSFALKDIAFKVYSPSENYAIEDSDITNANSMVLQIEIENKKFLFMGDATKSTEEYILKENDLEEVYLLSVGHHGSKTSTSEALLKEITPEIAVISAKESVYGHPSEDVLEVLKKYNVNILITEKMGAIRINI